MRLTKGDTRLKQKIHFILIFFLFVYIPVIAQKEYYNWNFGELAAITFNTTPPSFVSGSKLITGEGSSSISDPAGNILFYSDGVDVYNRKNVRMPHGDSLDGDWTSTSSCLIAKLPLSSSLYYVFTTGGWGYGTSVRYSIVDMIQDNGDGDVVLKNQLMFHGSTERIAGIHHANGVDIWILTMKYDSDIICIYKLTPSGLTAPSFFKTGMRIGDKGTSTFGQAKFSRDGKLFAFSDGGGVRSIYIYDFDTRTGAFSGLRKITNTPPMVYGLEFSPSGNLIYFSSARKNQIYQCEVKNYTIDFNDKSYITVLDDNSGYIYGQVYGQLQLAPDGRIYSLNTLQNEYLQAILYPDIPGIGCAYRDSVIYIGYQWSKANAGLPVCIPSAFPQPKLRYRNFCATDSTLLYLENNGADSVVWKFYNGKVKTTYSNDSSIKFLFPVSGAFPVEVVVYQGFSSDTFRTTVVKTGPDGIRKDIVLCENPDTVQLNARKSLAAWLWNTGDSTSAITVKDTGFYWVRFIDSMSCPSVDSFHVMQKSYQLFVNSETTLCIKSGMPAILNNPFEGNEYYWSNGDSTSSIEIKSDGIYSLTMKDLDGCIITDQVNVKVKMVNEIFIGNDITICKGNTVTLFCRDTGLRYRWGNNSERREIQVKEPGTYFLVMEDFNHCVDTASVTVSTAPCTCELEIPNVFTPGHDQFNDSFRIESDCPFSDFSLAIYNRWGEMVFSTSDPTFNWDGTKNNYPCPAGVYFVQVSYILPWLPEKTKQMSLPLSLFR